MRVDRSLLVLAAVLLGACTAEEASGPKDLASTPFGEQASGGGGGSAPSAASTTKEPQKATLAAAGTGEAALATNVDAATLTHPEVVLLLMAGKDGATWICTGSLVSSTVVVTAAHCLQSALFDGWEVVAPTLASRPRVRGTPRMYDAAWALSLIHI